MEIYDKLRDPLGLAVFILTLSLPIIVGFLTLKKTKGQSDFFVGGRAMDRIVVALSAVSSGRSSWLVLGLSGMAYTMGVGAVWAGAGYIIVELFQFIYIGRKLRVHSENFDSITMFDYFESKHDDTRHAIRITGSLIIAVFMTAYVAAQLNAGAKALDTAFDFRSLIAGVTGGPSASGPVLSIGGDIGFLVALVISGLLILVYMTMGGYIAVAYNDVVRAVIMLIGLVIFPAYGVIRLGGLDFLLRTLEQLDPSTIDPFSIGLGAVVGFLGIGLGSPGQPHIVVRYMSIDDAEKLRFAAVVGTVWNVLLAWGAVFIGLLGRAMIPEAGALPEGDPEMIYLVLSSEFFGPVLYGLLVGGIFAAILSTADSQLLVVASTFVRDLYEKVLRAHVVIDERRRLTLSRLMLLLSGIAAMILAYTASSLIFWLVLFAWSGLGASFGAALILSLSWEGTNTRGVVAGMITGAVVTIVWNLFLKEPTGLYELIPAFFCSALAVVIGSRFGSDRRPG